MSPNGNRANNEYNIAYTFTKGVEFIFGHCFRHEAMASTFKIFLCLFVFNEGKSPFPQV